MQGTQYRITIFIFLIILMFMNIGLFMKVGDLQESSKIQPSIETAKDFIEVYTDDNIYYLYPVSLCIEEERSSDRICFEKLWEMSEYIGQKTADSANRIEHNLNYKY